MYVAWVDFLDNTVILWSRWSRKEELTFSCQLFCKSKQRLQENIDRASKEEIKPAELHSKGKMDLRENFVFKLHLY